MPHAPQVPTSDWGLLRDERSLLKDDPNTVATLRFDGVDFELPLTTDDVLAVTETIYMQAGTEGLRTFLADNRLRSMIGTTHAARFVSAFQFAERNLMRSAQAHCAAIEVLAAEKARQALAQGRKATLAEAVRLFGRANVATVRFLNGLPREFLRLKADRAAFANLLQLVQRALTFKEALDDARYAFQGAVADATAEALERAGYDLGRHASAASEHRAAPIPPAAAARAEREVLARPHFAESRAALERQRDAFVVLMQRDGLREPLLWKLIDGRIAFDERMNADERTARLVTVVADALVETDAAAESIASDVTSDSAEVWYYPPLVVRAMHAAGIPESALAWRAAEERLAAMGDATAVQIAAVLTGMASLGYLAAAALVEVPPVSAGIAIAATVADVSIGLAATAQQAKALARQQAAYRAVLDPQASLMGEPNWMASWVFVALGMASVLSPIRLRTK